MDPFIESLREATVVKKFLDELERNPRRTLLALGAVLLLTGAGVTAALRGSTARREPLSVLPALPAARAPDGTYTGLPQAQEAERQLSAVLTAEESRRKAVSQELLQRKDDAPVSDREIKLINESGHVQY